MTFLVESYNAFEIIVNIYYLNIKIHGHEGFINVSTEHLNSCIRIILLRDRLSFI